MHDQNEYRCYDADWERLRSLTRLCTLAWILLLPVVGVIVTAAERFRLSEDTKLALIGLWFLTFLVMARRRHFFRCPRCRELFFSRRYYRNDWTRKCLHCGLKKFTELRFEDESCPNRVPGAAIAAIKPPHAGEGARAP